MMAIYEHVCFACDGFFEEIYSYKDPVPTVCSLCGVDGQVKRIPSVPSRGVVRLSGQEQKSKMKEEVNQLRHDMATNENVRANLIGEDKFNSNVNLHDADMRDVAKSDRNLADKFRP